MKIKLLSILGSSDEFFFEHRVFNGFIFTGFILSLSAIITNILLNLGFKVILASFLFAIFSLIIFYISRVKRYYKLPSIITVLILIFILSPSIWITNSGSGGGSQYFILLFGIVISVFSKGFLRAIFLISMFIVIVTLLIVETKYPEIIIQYPNEFSKKVDIAISYITSAIGIYILFIVFTNAYDSEHKKVLSYSEKLKELAFKDSLTSLLNHGKIISFLEMEVLKAERYERSLSILMIDIDFFKKINDIYGHPFGDIVLKGVSDILIENSRNTDYVGRYGGEEFLIVAPETPKDNAVIFAERVREKIEHFQFPNGVRITASIGVVSYQKEGFKELLEKADQNLYIAKGEGRNRVVST
ncbi:GGDEF domain-containing protein [bacterium]|nr:GGDEF domain-containing protein [bacterium]